MARRFSSVLSLVLGLSLALVFLLIIPVEGSEPSTSYAVQYTPQETTPHETAQQIAERTGLDVALVEQMLAARVPPGEINAELAREWPAHLAYLADRPRLRQLMRSSQRTAEYESMSALQEDQLAQQALWAQIEMALNQGDRATVLELAQSLPDEQHQQLLHDLQPAEIVAPSAPLPFIGINGNPCAYTSYTDAMTAAFDNDTIYTMQDTYYMTIGTIAKDLTFAPATNSCQTPASSGVTLDGFGTSQIAYVSNGTQVTFTNMILTNGNYSLGGILYVDINAQVVLDNTDLTNGYASSKGGALRIYFGTVEMINGSRIIDSQTGVGDYGGGVAIYEGTLILRDTSRVGDYLHGNSTPEHGGGIYMQGGLLQLYDNSRVRSNSANRGGGIYAEGGAQIELYDNSYVGYSLSTGGNTAYDGGGIYLIGTGSALKMSGNSAVRHNQTTHNGGGIYATSGASLDIDSASVIDNLGDDYGGGILVYGNTTANIYNGSDISYNKCDDPSDSHGAGIYIWDDGAAVTVTASTVISNVSNNFAGGIGIDGNSTLFISQDSDISDNEAGEYGGGLGIYTGTVTINKAIIQENTAGLSGGGIYIENGSLYADDPDIRFNEARDFGGGIYRSGGAAYLKAMTRHSLIGVNHALLHDGGGIYDNSGNTLNITAWNGFAFCINTNDAADDGGGIFATNSTYVDMYGYIEMTSNRAVGDGGAIYLEDGSTARLNDFGNMQYRPQVLSNDANTGNGGGIYALDSDVRLYGAIIGHSVNGNTAHVGSGGGVYLENSNMTMQNTLVQNNTAANDGGGIAVMTSTLNIDSIFLLPPSLATDIRSPEATYTNCDPNLLPADRYCTEFRYNSALDDGGAIYGDHSTLSIEHTAFYSNTANTASAFVSRYGLVNLYDSLFVGNDATGPNNATTLIYKIAGTVGSSVMNAMNNTWADNPDRAVSYTDESSGAFYNNIIWGNYQAGSINPPASTQCNDTQDGALTGAGNISQNPLFYTSARGDYRLLAGSPAVDACPSGTTPDLDNRSRPKGSAYDMGAFESNWWRVYLPVTFYN
jgi:predicted outer membrane repeat protein